MKSITKLLTVVSIIAVSSSAGLTQPPNTLSPAERREGWQLLFDGATTHGWRGAYATQFPARGWVVKDGELRGELHEGAESGDAGDIVTVKKYRHFEFAFDWKLGPGGNSGVKYFIEERQPKPEKGSQAGYEYQLIDDANYIYNGKKLPADLKTASIYDVVAAQKPDVSVGTWHRSRIVVNKNRIEHWLDGVKVLDVDRASDAFRRGVTESKFSTYPDFDKIPEGHILLQDHGHSVAFRNLKIKTLP
ncbi:3-keto-disaccharide hydrolase [Larkinella sp. VNQ87]|uniref:3-keto-disaccharide hydrolase n=1 Tax=Larkinella sp. VNQ87 TaxID=3400921 RepID=UPI003C107D7C